MHLHVERLPLWFISFLFPREAVFHHLPSRSTTQCCLALSDSPDSQPRKLQWSPGSVLRAYSTDKRTSSARRGINIALKIYMLQFLTHFICACKCVSSSVISLCSLSCCTIAKAAEKSRCCAENSHSILLPRGTSLPRSWGSCGVAHLSSNPSQPFPHQAARTTSFNSPWLCWFNHYHSYMRLVLLLIPVCT